MLELEAEAKRIHLEREKADLFMDGSGSVEDTHSFSRVTNFINLRYWELTNSSLVKVRTSDPDGFGEVLKTSKESNDSDTSYNLWRPRNLTDSNGDPIMDSDDRVLGQLVLVKEDFKKTSIGDFEVSNLPM